MSPRVAQTYVLPSSGVGNRLVQDGVSFPGGPPSCHRLGPLHMPFVASDVAVVVAIPIVAIAGLVARRPREQTATRQSSARPCAARIFPDGPRLPPLVQTRESGLCGHCF